MALGLWGSGVLEFFVLGSLHLGVLGQVAGQLRVEE